MARPEDLRNVLKSKGKGSETLKQRFSSANYSLKLCFEYVSGIGIVWYQLTAILICILFRPLLSIFLRTFPEHWPGPAVGRRRHPKSMDKATRLTSYLPQFFDPSNDFLICFVFMCHHNAQHNATHYYQVGGTKIGMFLRRPSGRPAAPAAARPRPREPSDTSCNNRVLQTVRHSPVRVPTVLAARDQQFCDVCNDRAHIHGVACARARHPRPRSPTSSCSPMRPIC